jgi:hypothetical protein
MFFLFLNVRVVSLHIHFPGKNTKDIDFGFSSLSTSGEVVSKEN